MDDSQPVQRGSSFSGDFRSDRLGGCLRGVYAKLELTTAGKEDDLKELH